MYDRQILIANPKVTCNEQKCNYPDCNCPFDMGSDNRCLIRLANESSSSPASELADDITRKTSVNFRTAERFGKIQINNESVVFWYEQ